MQTVFLAFTCKFGLCLHVEKVVICINKTNWHPLSLTLPGLERQKVIRPTLNQPMNHQNRHQKPKKFGPENPVICLNTWLEMNICFTKEFAVSARLLSPLSFIILMLICTM